MLFAMAMVLIGCGGGGSGGGTASSAAKVSAFATDDMNAGFDHVWVTIKSIDLQAAAGPVNLFSDAKGVTVDLKTLRDATGNRFRLLNRKSVPAGTYTGVSVTTTNSATVFTTGSTTAINATFSSTPGDFVMSLTFPTAVNVAGEVNDLCVDFKLSNWVLTGTSITAPAGFLSVGDTTHIKDPARHEASEMTGIVTALSGSAGAQTFTLGDASNATTVITNANTSIIFTNGAANPALANGQKVEVRGFWDATTNTLTAARIEIENGDSHEDFVGVQGSIASIAADGSSFVVNIHEAHHFHPASTTITVDLNSSTKFFGNQGAVLTGAQFLSTVAVGAFVAADGTLDAGTGHLVAARVKACDGETGKGGDKGGDSGSGGGSGEGGDSPILIGAESAFNATAGTFTLTIVDWEHVNTKPGATFSVTFTSATQWYWDGTLVDLSTLTDKLAAGRFVKVAGTVSGSTVAATQVWLRS